ncbi:nuclear transport factor 2 family protein [Chryseobacterium sp. S0630]|nr:nuclear transport factor 2 family protein [Chryseobacterium sp. S0630]
MNILKSLCIILIMTCSLSACGQRYKGHPHKKIKSMDTSKIKNTIVKQAVEAFQASDIKKWTSLFAEDAVLLDDGNPRNLKEFSTHAITIENFVSIDKVEDNGNSVYGAFHSDEYGDFKTYFKFHFNREGKINKLEIGQADY